MAFSGELRGITKAYGNCVSNNRVQLCVRAGTIHALVGENGAGKSTAMKILFGLVAPDSGDILFDGKRVENWSPQKAFDLGVGMVHQHFMLAGPETVLDNLVLGKETTRFGFRDRKAERRELEALMQATGLRLPLDAKVEDLAIGLQSRCEILKVLYRKARFLILDEPTAVLTPQETQDFLNTLKQLRASGNTVLIVTHKLKEVMAVADEATVLRAGKTVATRKTSETSVEELSELMVGRRLQLPRVSRAAAATAETRAKIKTSQVALNLKAGEIVGIAGVEGSGQDALIRALVEPLAAEVEFYDLLGADAGKFTPAEIRRLPVAIIPADRHKEGLVLAFSLAENLRLGRKQARTASHRVFETVTTEEKALLEKFDVRPSDPSLAAGALSGGNQQKLIVARELGDLAAQSLVIAVHPTRGVDLGAIEFIHTQLLAAAAAGSAVLLVSSELDELMALSHRIGVFFDGSIVQWFDGPPYDERAIGLAMLSGKSGAQGAAQ